MSSCFRCTVHGKVQGVFFRQSTLEQAKRLSITGHARNLPDGTVEVLACGDESALQVLRDWLKAGPEQARVERVDCEPVSPKSTPTDFETT